MYRLVADLSLLLQAEHVPNSTQPFWVEVVLPASKVGGLTRLSTPIFRLFGQY
jgi:hypothetical protein